MSLNCLRRFFLNQTLLTVILFKLAEILWGYLTTKFESKSIIWVFLKIFCATYSRFPFFRLFFPDVFFKMGILYNSSRLSQKNIQKWFFHEKRCKEQDPGVRVDPRSIIFSGKLKNVELLRLFFERLGK